MPGDVEVIKVAGRVHSPRAVVGPHVSDFDWTSMIAEMDGSWERLGRPSNRFRRPATERRREKDR